MNTRRYSIDDITKSTINVEGEIIRRMKHIITNKLSIILIYNLMSMKTTN